MGIGIYNNNRREECYPPNGIFLSGAIRNLNQLNSGAGQFHLPLLMEILDRDQSEFPAGIAQNQMGYCREEINYLNGVGPSSNMQSLSF